MFVGLFIVVHAFQMHVVSQWGIADWHFLMAHPISHLSLASAVVSNLVSNVPAVLLFEPVMRAVPAAMQQTRGWRWRCPVRSPETSVFSVQSPTLSLSRARKRKALRYRSGSMPKLESPLRSSPWVSGSRG